MNAPQTQPKATGLIKFCNRKTDVGNALHDLSLNPVKYYINEGIIIHHESIHNNMVYIDMCALYTIKSIYLSI